MYAAYRMLGNLVRCAILGLTFTLLTSEMLISQMIHHALLSGTLTEPFLNHQPLMDVCIVLDSRNSRVQDELVKR